MLGTFDASTFLADFFEQRPLYLNSACDLAIDVDDVLATLPAAFENGQVRVLNASIGRRGLSRESILARLGGLTTTDAFRKMFADGDVSFLIQEFEGYFPAVRRHASELGSMLGLRVDVTAFLSPPCSIASVAHYDRSEVFVQQVVGKKVWDLYEPIHPLPTTRDVSYPVHIESLKPLGTHQLVEGDMLYLPRGVVHDVRNTQTGPSLHLSYVASVDSWTSLFGNLMDSAYMELRSLPSWREGIRCSSLDAAGAGARIGEMIEELGKVMQTMVSGLPGRFLDHCLNDQRQLDLLAAGRASSKLLDVPGEPLALRLNGSHFLQRHTDDTGTRISSDGNRFYPINAAVLTRILREDHTLDSLVDAGLCSEDELLDALTVLVSQAGVASLTPAHSAEGA